MMVEVEQAILRSEILEKTRPFTPKQIELLQFMVDGLTDCGIADKLGVPVGIVKNRKNRIGKKIVSNQKLTRYEAMFKAVFMAVMEGSLNCDKLPEVSPSSLTSQGLEVCAFMAIGYANPRIADVLMIEYTVVGKRVSDVIKRLKVKNRYQAIALGAHAMKLALEAEAKGQTLGV